MARGMAQGNRLAKFRRITELFEEGQAVVLDPNPEDPVLVWVNKLNPFEMDEARKDGSVGRAMSVMKIADETADEHVVFEAALNGRSKDDILGALVAAKANEHYVAALDDIRADEKWHEKLAVLERGDEQLNDAGVDLAADERSRLARLNEDYITQVQELLAGYQTAYRAELATETEDRLREMYRQSYSDSAGSNGFLTEYRTTELFYAMRACDATPRDSEDGGWDHSACDHSERLCEHRGQVRELPEGLITAVRAAIVQLNMSPREAGNSDAPASSSASSGPRSEAADSTRSTPVGT